MIVGALAGLRVGMHSATDGAAARATVRARRPPPPGAPRPRWPDS